jgi:hypothetical protein
VPWHARCSTSIHHRTAVFAGDNVQGSDSFAPGSEKEIIMLELATILPMAAAGWAFLVWLFGGGFGLAILVFIVLKALGR